MQNPTITGGSGTGGGGSSAWGGITGTLSDQTDLQTALDGKQNNISATVSVTTTGTQQKPFNFTIVQPQAVNYNNEEITAPGIWISGVGITESASASAGFTTVTLNNVTGATGVFSLSSFAFMTSFTASNLKIWIPSSFSSNATLQILSMPELVFCGGSISPASTGLTTLNFPKLKYVTGNIAPVNSSITELSFPELFIADGQFAPGTLSALTTISVPKVEYIGIINISACNALGSVSFPELKQLGWPGASNALGVATATSLTTISIPKLIRMYGSVALTTTTEALTSLTFGTIGTLKEITGNVVVSSAALTESNVNAILALLVSLDGTNGTTLYGSGKTITLTGTSAAPTGQGLTDKDTLIARGATVTTN